MAEFCCGLMRKCEFPTPDESSSWAESVEGWRWRDLCFLLLLHDGETCNLQRTELQRLECEFTVRRRLTDDFKLTELNMTECKGKVSEKAESYSEQALKKSRGLNIEGYPIEGLSIGGHETCLIFPTLNVPSLRISSSSPMPT